MIELEMSQIEQIKDYLIWHHINHENANVNAFMRTYLPCCPTNQDMDFSDILNNCVYGYYTYNGHYVAYLFRAEGQFPNLWSVFSFNIDRRLTHHLTWTNISLEQCLLILSDLFSRG